MTDSQLILASASTARATLLKNAGIHSATQPARIDEEEIKLALRADGAAPRDQADALAEMKALSVSRKNPGMFVLGADQILALGNDTFDKPKSIAEAREHLTKLRGNRHQLLSAAVIALDGEPIWRHIGVARLMMRPFTDQFLDEYLTQIGEDVLTTVGGYKLEGIGAQLFARIDGDYFTILGLPLIETLGFLRVRGVLTE
ncbi:MAG: Maf family protein [Pikeienuella sp.]